MDRRLIEMESASVLVIGDLILDRYWYGTTLRISPEAPVPVVHVSDIEERVGGAANVAANAAAVGARTTLVGILGQDDRGDKLLELCRAHGIDTHVARRSQGSTTVKLRVISQNQQLIRADFEDELPEDLSGEVLNIVERQLGQCDIVVVSDYAKGSVTRVPDIINAATVAKKPIVVDPKGSDFSRYAGATLLTPNLAELTAVVGPCSSAQEIEQHARDLCREHVLGAVLVTRGDAGMSLIRAAGEVVHLQAQARDVFDVTGAGDTVCAVTAAAMAAGNDLVNAVMMANAAAGLVVGKLGTATVSRDEIDSALVALAGIKRGGLDKAALLEEVANARRRGESIVMTNGCFDIIHAGHVRYLNEAASMGNRLIVAINDDASVAELKGSGRPLNDLESRMQVLAALEAVEWVVPFSDATPRALIAEILPDLLVKGGDYAIADIAGSAEVLAAGGTVTTLAYHDGYSTSELLGRAETAGGDSA